MKYITSRHESVTNQVRHDRIKVDGPDQDDGKTNKINESQEGAETKKQKSLPHTTAD